MTYAQQIEFFKKAKTLFSIEKNENDIRSYVPNKQVFSPRLYSTPETRNQIVRSELNNLVMYLRSVLFNVSLRLHKVESKIKWSYGMEWWINDSHSVYSSEQFDSDNEAIMKGIQEVFRVVEEKYPKRNYLDKLGVDKS